MVDNVIDSELARVLDLLEQIREVNKMIALHRDNSGNALMQRQYEDLKERFVKELGQILKDFNLKVEPLEKAA